MHSMSASLGPRLDSMMQQKVHLQLEKLNQI